MQRSLWKREGLGVDARLRADAIAGRRVFLLKLSAATVPLPILSGIVGGGVAAALYRDRFGAMSLSHRGGRCPPCFGFPTRAWCVPTRFYPSGAPAAHCEF